MAVQEDLFVTGPAAPVDAAPAAEGHEALARGLPPRVRLGTSSWSFPGWAGLVYDRVAPQGVLARHGLAAYARHPLFRAVGFDRSYYEAPPAGLYRDFADDVGPDFRFVVKAERSLVTPRIRSARGWAPSPFWLDAAYAADRVVAPAAEGLGDRLGALLFQFPPVEPVEVSGARRFAEDLYHFLDALPEGVPYAVEIRTPGLLTDDYAGALRHGGAVHAASVHTRAPELEEQLRRFPPGEGAGPFVLRWMLRPGAGYEEARERYAPFDALVDEDPERRDAIAGAAVDAAAAGRDVFVVVNNKAEGSSPLSVARLAEAISVRA